MEDKEKETEEKYMKIIEIGSDDGGKTGTFRFENYGIESRHVPTILAQLFIEQMVRAGVSEDKFVSSMQNMFKHTKEVIDNQ